MPALSTGFMMPGVLNGDFLFTTIFGIHLNIVTFLYAMDDNFPLGFQIEQLILEVFRGYFSLAVKKAVFRFCRAGIYHIKLR